MESLFINQLDSQRQQFVILQYLNKIMQLSQQKGSRPIPLIQFEGERFKITEEAICFLKKFQNPLGVITIVGKYRTGKSLFLNKVLLNNTQSFKVCPTINSCTKGLWISRQVIKSQHPDAPDMDTIVIDTQGFGAMEQSDAYNNRILLFALLLSSYFIYNSVGSIDEKSLNNLNVITNLAKELQAKNLGNDKIQEQFPTFMWVVRDFTLRLVDANGCIMEPKEYLQYALQIQKGISDAVQNKNKIRRMIKHFFKERDCYTLVTPVENEMDLQQLNSLPDSALRPQFLQQIQSLRQKILKRIKPKRLKHRKLTGETFLQLANSYVEAINSGSLPNIQSAWKSINNYQIVQTLTKTKQLIKKKSQQFVANLQSQKSFEDLQKELLSESLAFMKKKISTETDFEQNYSSIKQYISQSITNAKLENKKKSMQILLQHFHEKCGDFGYEESEQLQKKWKLLETVYKNQFKQNPSTQQFLVQHFYPLKFESFSSLLKHESECLKINQQQKQQMKQSYEKRIRQLDDNKRQVQQKIYDSQREISFLKARSEQQSKIKGLEISYLQKQLNETKDQLYRQQQKNELYQAEIKSKQTEINELKLKLNSISYGLKQSDEDRNYTKKELQILKQHLSSKGKQIELLKKINSQLTLQIEKMQERQRNTSLHVKNQIQNKSEQYEELAQKYEQMQRQNLSFSQKIVKLQSTLEAEANRIMRQEKLYETMLHTLKTNFQAQRHHTLQLTQANRNMAFALKHLEQRFEQTQQKQKKMKEFKRCFKNSSCMQCQNCSKFFVPAIFSQHLNVCILSPQTFKRTQVDKPVNTRSQLQISVKQTLLKDSDSKPYTQYVLELKKGDKLWTINRKYKDFCALHGQLKTLLPGVNLSDFSYIVNPQQGSKKSLLVQQRRKIFEKYLRDLCSNPYIAQQRIWKQFIEDNDTDSINPIIPHALGESKLAISELLRTQKNIEMSHNSPQKQNNCDSNRYLGTQNHKSPQQFLRIWNERNLRAKEVSKNKKNWN